MCDLLGGSGRARGAWHTHRQAPDRPPAPHQIAKQEFEYTRHGTTTLIAGLCVVTGAVLLPSLGPTRTEGDFLPWIRTLMATAPGTAWVFVADRLNVHWSESLVRDVSASGL